MKKIGKYTSLDVFIYWRDIFVKHVEINDNLLVKVRVVIIKKANK